eukprot:m.73837 g.73837  ORF g.73837 m.73837 type:complete len:785 (+) comp7744_c0_seq2:79-2433(+)
MALPPRDAPGAASKRRRQRDVDDPADQGSSHSTRYRPGEEQTRLWMHRYLDERDGKRDSQGIRWRLDQARCELVTGFMFQLCLRYPDLCSLYLRHLRDCRDKPSIKEITNRQASHAVFDAAVEAVRRVGSVGIQLALRDFAQRLAAISEDILPLEERRESSEDSPSPDLLNGSTTDAVAFDSDMLPGDLANFDPALLVDLSPLPSVTASGGRNVEPEFHVAGAFFAPAVPNHVTLGGAAHVAAQHAPTAHDHVTLAPAPEGADLATPALSPLSPIDPNADPAITIVTDSLLAQDSALRVEVTRLQVSPARMQTAMRTSQTVADFCVRLVADYPPLAQVHFQLVYRPLHDPSEYAIAEPTDVLRPPKYIQGQRFRIVILGVARGEIQEPRAARSAPRARPVSQDSTSTLAGFQATSPSLQKRGQRPRITRKPDFDISDDLKNRFLRVALTDNVPRELSESLKYQYKAEFLDSLTGTYSRKQLKISVTHIEVLPHNAVLEVRYHEALAKLEADGCSGSEVVPRFVYHACHPSIVSSICKDGLRAAQCASCLKGEDLPGHDGGWFGNHSRGVYVSSAADYSLFYSTGCEVRDGDSGLTVMLEVVIGRVRHFQTPPGSIPPTPGVHAHESPHGLEYFIFDAAQVIPRAVVHWRATFSPLAGVMHDGQALTKLAPCVHKSPDAVELSAFEISAIKMQPAAQAAKIQPAAMPTSTLLAVTAPKKALSAQPTPPASLSGGFFAKFQSAFNFTRKDTVGHEKSMAELAATQEAASRQVAAAAAPIKEEDLQP